MPEQLQRAVTTQGEETIPEVLDHLANGALSHNLVDRTEFDILG
jgi:hypothetical protein